MNPVTFQIEPETPKVLSIYKELLKLEQHLRDSETAVDLGRNVVAQMAREHGFWAYTGGHHVAVHTVPGSPRLALITATSPDWF